MRIVAVDWSGAVTGAERKIWLAEAEAGRLVRLEDGRTREALGAHLVQLAAADPKLVIGLDFAFSLPAWFLAERGLADAPALWELVAREGDAWLATCAPPFWGRPGRRKPAMPAEFRATDRAVPATNGVRPKSAFQIGGAGAVGTGSLRGMPILRQLRAAGIRIWPFDPPEPPFVVEIYPRVLTGPVVKGRAEARAAALAARRAQLNAEQHAAAVASEDAFDAALAALGMDAARASLAALPVLTDPVSRTEGRIWVPD